MENVVISFIIPVYNVEAYLEKCVLSIIEQAPFPIEIIIVDDGSTDDSSKIAKTFSLNYKNIKYFYKENGGLGSARNFGLNKATGRYVSFVDSDDYLSKDFCKVIHPLLSKNYDIIRFNFSKIIDHKIIDEYEQSFDDIPSLKRGVLCDIIGNQVCKNIFKRSLVSNTNFKENVLYEDLYWTYTIYYKTDNIIAINNCLYCYYMRQSSISHSGKKQKIANDVFYAFLEKTRFANCLQDKIAIDVLTKKTINHALTNMLYAKKRSLSYIDSKNFIKKNKSYIESKGIKFYLIYYFNFLAKFVNKIKSSN